MTWAIHIARPGKPDAWHTGHTETENVSEAKTYATREQAEAHRALTGLYKLCGWISTVKEVTCAKPPTTTEGSAPPMTTEETEAEHKEAEQMTTEKMTVTERKKKSRQARMARRAAEGHASPAKKAAPKKAAPKKTTPKKKATAKKKVTAKK